FQNRGCRSRCMKKDCECFVYPLTANQVDHESYFTRSNAHVSGKCLSLHGNTSSQSAFDYRLPVFLSSSVWPLNVLVGANSPSLWPTISSVTYTGTCFRPSYTANV